MARVVAALRRYRWRRLVKQMRPVEARDCSNYNDCGRTVDPADPAVIWIPMERVLLCGPECYQVWYEDRFG